MKQVIPLILALACVKASAGPEILYGSWDGGDTAAISIYGVLKVSKDIVAWGGQHEGQACRASYTILAEPPGVVFEDQIGREYHTGAEGVESFLLKLQNLPCTKDLGYLRLTILHDLSQNSLALVEYSSEKSVVGLMHFDRRQP